MVYTTITLLLACFLYCCQHANVYVVRPGTHCVLLGGLFYSVNRLVCMNKNQNKHTVSAYKWVEGATACNYRYVVLPVVIPLHYHCITMITGRLLNSVLRLLYGTQCLAALVRSCFYWPMSGRLFSAVVKFYCSDSF